MVDRGSLMIDLINLIASSDISAPGFHAHSLGVIVFLILIIFHYRHR
jgi:hypothetical protein